MARLGDQHDSIPAPGAILGGKYRVVRQLGEGGMGVVLEAEHTLSGKRVAIKWLRPAIAGHSEAVERMLREARASARVRHPNVVDVYDVVPEGSSVFLVMELLEGEPLSALLARGQLPQHELIALLLDAMRGVLAAHKQGVVHRDIKPDNIFLAHELDRHVATPKVLDFGISKSAQLEGMSLTRTGSAIGTPIYMSFEQLSGVRDVDGRTDVYAFGVILYEALSGQAPFQAETLPELVFKMTNTEPVPLKRLRPDLPDALERLVRWAMARDREQRVPTLDVLIRELEPFAARQVASGGPAPATAQSARSAPLSSGPVPSLGARGAASTVAQPRPVSRSVASTPLHVSARGGVQTAASSKTAMTLWVLACAALPLAFWFLGGRQWVAGLSADRDAVHGASGPSTTVPAEPRHAPPAVPRGAAEPASTPSTQGQPAVKPTEPAPPVEPAAQAPTAAEPERGGGGTATPGAAPGASDGAEGMRTGRVPDPRGKPRALKLMQARLRAHQRARGAEPTEQAPAEAKDVPAPPQEPPRLKAGKPRSQDF